MTKIMQIRPVTLARLALLCAPVALVGACAAPGAPPPPGDALAIAQQAQATANQALQVAQQAMAAATQSRTATSEMYQRSLQK